MTGKKADDNAADNHAVVERVLNETLAQLSPKRLQLVMKFANQIAAIHDPDAIQTFMRWYSDPRLDSLLQLASQLDSDVLDQLLFFAEELASES
jgi:hypothetical protein